MNWKFFLFPFAWLYGLIIKIRNVWFDKGILTTQTFSVPTITVGNIAVGGTGKTPHVEYLVRLLSENYKLAILSRGYKRKTKGFRYVENRSTVIEVGDEPLQFKQKFPHVTVAVDEKRVHGITQLLKNDSTLDLIILDDAFQHRYVKPDLSILLTEYTNPYSKDYLMPVGRLREHRIGAQRADMIVVTKSPYEVSKKTQSQMVKSLKINANQHCFFSYIKYGNLCGVFNDINIELIDNQFIILITGIANPLPLKQYLSASAGQVIHLSYPDHYTFKKEDINTILSTYQQHIQKQPLIITTEKDAMRLKSNQWASLIQTLPIYYLPIEIDFIGAQKELFDKEIRKMLN